MKNAAAAVRAKKLLIAGIIGCLLYVAGDFLFAATGKGQTTETIGLFVRVAYLEMADWRMWASILCGFVGSLGQDGEPVVLQGRVVIMIEVIQAHDVHGLTLKALFQEPQHQIAANKPGAAGYQNLFHFPLNFRFASS